MTGTQNIFTTDSDLNKSTDKSNSNSTVPSPSVEPPPPKPILYKRTSSSASAQLSKLPPISTNTTTFTTAVTNKTVSPLSEARKPTVVQIGKITTNNKNEVLTTPILKNGIITTNNKNEVPTTPILKNGNGSSTGFSTNGATINFSATTNTYPGSRPHSPVIHGNSRGSISFQCPPSSTKHRGSISARPSITKITSLDLQQSGIPSSRQPSNPNSTAKNPYFQDSMSSPGKRRSSLDYKSTTTTATTNTTATVQPDQFSDSRHTSIKSTSGSKVNLKSPNFNGGAFGSTTSMQSPIHFELPQHAHPLQHFSFPDENAIHQQTDDLAGLGFNMYSGSNLHSYPTHAVSSPTTTTTTTPTSPFTFATRTNSIKRKAPPKAVVSDPVGPIVPFTNGDYQNPTNY
ncbi:unnamed protein product [Ambrosiozyma monospora]|uniref:Unnamed protein product n=1 Tax=Ambrosiozyma monospora TaxID=43982 RepID=A0A9W6YU28_AMBMO|nr:unnamed protein product [Ambrosiozyma monospora]